MTDGGHVPSEGLPEHLLAGSDPAGRPEGVAVPAAPAAGVAEQGIPGFPVQTAPAHLQGATLHGTHPMGGEGLLQRPGFTFLDQPDTPDPLDDEDDVLLMPGPQGSWSEPVVHGQPEPSPVAAQAPAGVDTVALRALGDPHPGAVAESAAGTPVEPSWPPLAPPVMTGAPSPQDLTAPAARTASAEPLAQATGPAAPPLVAASAPAPDQLTAVQQPRRPLHAGPPIPDPSLMTGHVPVRSLADRGPSQGGTPAHGVRIAAPVEQPQGVPQSQPQQPVQPQPSMQPPQPVQPVQAESSVAAPAAPVADAPVGAVPVTEAPVVEAPVAEVPGAGQPIAEPLVAQQPAAAAQEPTHRTPELRQAPVDEASAQPAVAAAESVQADAAGAVAPVDPALAPPVAEAPEAAAVSEATGAQPAPLAPQAPEASPAPGAVQAPEAVQASGAAQAVEAAQAAPVVEPSPAVVPEQAPPVAPPAQPRGRISAFLAAPTPHGLPTVEAQPAPQRGGAHRGAPEQVGPEQGAPVQPAAVEPVAAQQPVEPVEPAEQAPPAPSAAAAAVEGGESAPETAAGTGDMPSGRPVDAPAEEPQAAGPAAVPASDAPVADALVVDAPVAATPTTDAPVVEEPVSGAPAEEVTGQAVEQAVEQAEGPETEQAPAGVTEPLQEQPPAEQPQPAAEPQPAQQAQNEEQAPAEPQAQAQNEQPVPEPEQPRAESAPEPEEGTAIAANAASTDPAADSGSVETLGTVPEQEPPAEAGPRPPAAPGYDQAGREAVHQVIRERRDVRNGFRPDPIPHEVLIRVLEAAHTAPSVGYSQPWDFVVIRSAKTRRKMHELAERQRVAYADSLPKGRAKQFKEIKIEAILDTPVNIVVTADRTRGGRHTLGRHTQPQMAPYSAALAVENLWLAARAEGLGVGWVSFFDEDEMVRELGLPEHLEVVAYLCVGYVDSFPEEPELQQQGWAKKRPLSWVVHEEQYGNRALPGEEPHSLLADTLRGIRPLDAKALGEAWDRQKRMTKPAGSLGMLEIISAQLCGLSRKCPPPIPEPGCVAIFAGDHGVHAQGVSPWPQEVTAQMVANFLAGGAVINSFAKQIGTEVVVVDVGVKSELPDAIQSGRTTGLLPRKVKPGTDDMTQGPAMSREEALKAIEVGIETARDLVAAGNKILITGDMGIGNTTASAALISVFAGLDPAEVTGRGTGIDDAMHAHKIEVIRAALALHQPDPSDPIGVLAAVGGLEHAAIAGFVLGAASLRTPVVLDGVIAGSAALAAKAIAPEVLAACIAGHRSAEPGHQAALAKLGLRPLIDLDLRLGEGTGALLALPLVQSAARSMHDVATFDSAGVTEKA